MNPRAIAMDGLADQDHHYRLSADGVMVPKETIAHRNEEYREEGFDVLARMQKDHFWYRGRHRFLLNAVRKELSRRDNFHYPRPAAVDLGGGCGGWLRYLAARCPEAFSELALADSSLSALDRARAFLPASVERYQIDLLNLHWRERWDIAFLLDVLEHIPPDEQALLQIRDSLKPGGTLFVATPALRAFWSYNDELAHHVRRYSRQDFQKLAERCGYRLRDSRYFMFYLSPLLYLARLRGPKTDKLTTSETKELLAKTHRIPTSPVNTLLTWVFGAETPLGHRVRFPWGTSVLGIFEKA